MVNYNIFNKGLMATEFKKDNLKQTGLEEWVAKQ